MARRFRATGNFETSAPNDLKMTLNVKRSRYLIYIVHIPPSPKFHPTASHFELQAIFRQLRRIVKFEWPQEFPFQPILFYSQPFRIIGHFQTNALNDPQMTLNTERSNVAHIQVIITPSSKFQSVLLNSQMFSTYRPFWDKHNEWPQNDVDH